MLPSMDSDLHVAIVGGGIGGLAAALSLATQGVRVTVLERQDDVGGKARRVNVDGVAIDAGPTVFTLRDIFDQLAIEAGETLDDHLKIEQADLLARHAWSDGSRLDLFAERARSIDAIGAFAGADAARGYARFAADSERLYTLLDQSYMRAPGAHWPGPMMARIGLTRLTDMLTIQPFRSLWSVLGDYFDDPRLRQLFGRYATYCGSSPFDAPATLMLIAHVEARGVWTVKGGLQALGGALASMARAKGAVIHTGVTVTDIDADPRCVTLDTGERMPVDAVIANADPQALADGRFGSVAERAVPAMPARQRSLSAMTWMCHAQTQGMALSRHNIFFSDDYGSEFAALRDGQIPPAPTVYVCGQDRSAAANRKPVSGRERLQMIVNAPAIGDIYRLSDEEKKRCTMAMRKALGRCGLQLEEAMPHQLVSPAEYESLFPSTGGALYGRASHGWAASFRRPHARTRIPWLFLTGGATHPGAGVPMAALSGRLAAQALMEDRASISRSRPVAMAGGMSTPSATTAATG